MIQFADDLDELVKLELAEGQPAALIVTPLVNMLARLTVGVHNKTGADINGLLDILRNQLDEAVAHYVTHNSAPDRRPDAAPGD